MMLFYLQTIRTTAAHLNGAFLPDITVDGIQKTLAYIPSLTPYAVYRLPYTGFEPANEPLDSVLAFGRVAVLDGVH
jgi:hypothetical protein